MARQVIVRGGDDKTFNDLLAQLQGSNILSGLQLTAQAELLSKQDEATKQTLAEFNKALRTLDAGGMPTTSEQLAEMEGSEAYKEGEESITKATEEYMTSMQQHLANKEAIQSLYSGTMRKLEGIGSPEAIRTAKVLGEEMDRKLLLEDEKSKMQLAEVEFKNALYGLSLNRIDYTMAEKKLELAMQDVDATELAYKMTNDPEGKWYEFLTKLKQDEAFGAQYYDLETEYKRLRDTYHTKENDKIFNQAMGIIDAGVQNRVWSFRSTGFKMSDGQYKTIQEQLTAYNNQFAGLVRKGINRGYILTGRYNENGVKEDPFRDARIRYREAEQQLNDEKETNKFTKFGEDVEVIRRMKLNETEGKEFLLGDVFYSASEVAAWMNNNFYSSRSNSENYWAELDRYIGNLPDEEQKKLQESKTWTKEFNKETGRYEARSQNVFIQDPLSGGFIRHDISRLYTRDFDPYDLGIADLESSPVPIPPPKGGGW